MKILHLGERRKQIGKEEAERLLSLKVTRGGTGALQNIQQTVSALLGVQIDAFQSESPSADGEVSPELDVDDFLVEVNGSGIREALRVVLDVEFEQPTVLLIEEPEIHLHPSLETSMMGYLKGLGEHCQVFVSTHSTNFLDTGDLRNVYLVSKEESTQVRLLDYEEAVEQVPRELGLRLSSLFMYDRLVFVEGSCDENVLREFAGTVGVNLSQYSTGFIHMGGVRTFAHFAAEATLSFLSRRNTRMCFIIDRDEKDEADVARLQELAGDHATLFVLSRRELENYLICARALREFIGLKQDLLGGGRENDVPPESSVEIAIDSCADRLKQFTVDKRAAKRLCRPIYPDTKSLFEDIGDAERSDTIVDELQRCIEHMGAAKAKVSETYEEEQRLVDEAWTTSKLDIVPGDVLLDLVCREYGVRFKKERDAGRLAGLMRADEIADEMVGIIRALVE